MSLDINGEILEISKVLVQQDFHFTGGLKGFLTDKGWALVPVPAEKDTDALVFKTQNDHYNFATNICSAKFIGTCVHYNDDASTPPMDIWESGIRDKKYNLNIADCWSAISHQASAVKDHDYSDCSKHVSVCLRVAGLRLRDISNKYHAQLKWALANNTDSGTWFSNMAMLDLYADFHSFASELSSVRDHLARIAAIHIGAPDGIDSLARLIYWLDKKENNAKKMKPIPSLLLSASGTKSNPNWLLRLGTIRNEMLHRTPMAANESVAALTLKDISTVNGVVKTIRLGQPPKTIGHDDQAEDPLDELSTIYGNLEFLCREIQKYTRYQPVIPSIVYD